MAVTSPESAQMARVKAVFDAEFAAESLTLIYDDIHESLGTVAPVAGICADASAPLDANAQVLEMRLIVKCFDRWDAQIDPTQTVDPRPITEWAERFRRACQTAGSGASTHDWYFQVVRVEYPRDPTGNRTRFVALVQGFAGNPAIVETTG